jgi:glucose-6-phosphate isomerase
VTRHRVLEALARTGRFHPGLQITFPKESMGFQYGFEVFGPEPEYRSLNAIRPSLRNPGCGGPDPVYAIAMDVGRRSDIEQLKKRMLLFGIVIYAPGKLGDELVRSQGHVHAISSHSGWSAPELFEIWQGRAIVYSQEKSGNDPGRCIAIEAREGERVVMPPAWAHFVANADPHSRLIFGAWCDRQYGFDYSQVRSHDGLAWFPLIDADGMIRWEANSNYSASKLQCRRARAYPELGLTSGMPIYEYVTRDPDAIQWISDPARFSQLWPQFEP